MLDARGKTTTKLTPDVQKAVLNWPCKYHIPIIECDSRRKKVWLPEWQKLDLNNIDWEAKLRQGCYDNGIVIRLGRCLSNVGEKVSQTNQVDEYIKNFSFPTLRERQSYVLNEIAPLLTLTLGTSYICTSTKDLQTQYARDFPFLKVAKGKNNFICAVKD